VRFCGKRRKVCKKKIGPLHFDACGYAANKPVGHAARAVMAGQAQQPRKLRRPA